jgi:hypothetical protein
LSRWLARFVYAYIRLASVWGRSRGCYRGLCYLRCFYAVELSRSPVCVFPCFFCFCLVLKDDCVARAWFRWEELVLKSFRDSDFVDTLLELFLDCAEVDRVEFRAASIDANSSLVVTSGLGDGRFLGLGIYGYPLDLVRW